MIFDLMILAVPMFNGLLKQTTFNESVPNSLIWKIFHESFYLTSMPETLGALFQALRKFKKLSRILNTSI